MQKVLEKLKEIESNDIGLSIYSSIEQKVVASLNSEITVPVTSGAKVCHWFLHSKMGRRRFSKLE